MKKVVALLLVALVALGFVFANGSQENAEKIIKIGLCQPITGSMAMSGLYSRHGVELAVDEINENGGITVGGEIYKLELLIEDNEGKVDVTINAVNKLISDGCIAIIGTNSSGTSKAGGQIATEAKVPMITTTGTNPDVTKVAGEYMFRTTWIDSYQGEVAAKLAWKLGGRRAALIYNNGDDYSTGIKDYFVKAFEEMGGETFTQAYAGAEIKDFKAQITAIKNWGPDIIFLEAQAAELPLQIQQIRELGLDTQIIGAASWDNDLMIQLTPAEDIEGCIYVTTFCATSDDPLAKAFTEAYQAKWDGELPMNQAVMSYNAVKVIEEALKHCSTVNGGEELRDAIWAVDMDLPNGHFSYDENRDPQVSGVVMWYKDGKGQYYGEV